MRNIPLLLGIGFLKGLYFLAPIFSLFLISKDIPLAAIVISQVLYSVFVFLGEVPTGLFADRFGQKVSILLGYALDACGILLVLASPSLTTLYISFAIRGISGSFLSGSEEALLYESVKRFGTESFQKIYGRMRSNEQIGFVLATAFAGVTYQIFGSNAFIPLIFLTATALLGAMACAFGLQDFGEQIRSQDQGAGLFRVLGKSLKLIRQNETIFILTVVGALTISGEYFIQAVYQPYFEFHGVSGFWLGAVISIGTILNILAMRNIHRIEKWAGLEKILLVLNVTFGFLYLSMVAFPHPAMLIAAYLLMNGLFNLEAPIVSDYINARTHGSIRTTVLSGVSFARRFFQAIIGWGLGIAVGAFGTQTTLAMQGFYLLIGIAISYYLLVKCGCAHPVDNPEGEELEFSKL